MRENTTLRAWRAGRQTVGGWLSLASNQSAEMLAAAGFDWLCVDLQHGLIDYGDLTGILQAISTSSATPLVRVPWNQPDIIMKALDAGAYGVIVPLVNSRAEAEAAVAACRYPPLGLRSFGPIRAAAYGGRGYATEANAELACVVMIETERALQNLDDILATPGLDGAYVGPNDLALSLDLPAIGDTTEPRHLEAVGAILAACRRHGIAAGIHASSLEWAQRRLAAGFQFVTLGSDLGFMMRAAREELAAVRGVMPPIVERTGY